MNFKRLFAIKPRALLAIFIGVVLILSVLVPKISRASADFNYNIDVNYIVSPDGPTTVKETYKITNKTSTQYLDSIKVSTPGADIAGLQVYYSDGASIPFETSKLTQNTGNYKYEYTEIKVNFNRANVGQDLTWSFVIQYDTADIVENKGRANVVYIPGISPENRNEYNVRLTVPSSFGQVHGFGNIPKLVSQNSSSKSYQFSQEDLFNNSVQLLFGDSATYKVDFIYPLKNDSKTSKDFEIALPPSTETQTSFIEKIEPKPLSTRVDGDGNVIAKYNLAANQNIDVKVDVLADVKYIQYDLANSGTVSDIPQALKNKYTNPTKYWQSDSPQIKQKAAELTAGKKTVAEKVRAINDYVVSTLTYNDEKIKYNIRQGGLQALNNPNNVVCLEYSDLTISLLRAANIPARMPVGYGYSGDLKKSPAVSDSLHSWVQAYVPNNGWINLDPTWGEKFNNFGISDIDHLAFAIWGESDSTPSAITVNGKDANYQYENVKLEYTSIQPQVSNDAKLSSTKWVILPFLSVISYTGTTSSNSSTFDLKLELNQGAKKSSSNLGSKAPAQKISGVLLDLGLGFALSYKLGLASASSASPIASSSGSNNYLPIAAISVLLLGIIIWRVIKLRNTKKTELEAPKDLKDETKPPQ